MRAPDRQMLELESYSIHASNDYVKKFGLDTSYMSTWTHPKDYIVNVKLMNDASPPTDEVMSFVSSSTTKASTAGKTFVGDHHIYDFHSLKQHTEDNMYKGDMEELLSECKPNVDTSGKLIAPSLLSSLFRVTNKNISRSLNRTANQEISMSI
jgi:hypothetical protein